MCAPLLPGQMVASKMCLLPQGLGPVKEIPLHGTSHRKARDNPEFSVGTMVDQKKNPSPEANLFLKILNPTVWMDLESIMLSEISQAEKDKYHMISLTCAI